LSKHAFFVVVFPDVIPFFRECLASLAKQSFRNFDLLVANDGVDSLRDFRELIDFVELPARGTPAAIRADGLMHIRHAGYDQCIFGDADDFFETNRIECVLSLLEKNDIVLNDLTLVNQRSSIVARGYLGQRLANLEDIKYDFILDKNCIGLSNSAMRMQIADDLVFQPSAQIVDWNWYSQLLAKGRTATFASKTQTYYRQYDGNNVGLGKFNADAVLAGVETKVLHYRHLKELGLKGVQERHNDFVSLLERLRGNAANLTAYQKASERAFYSLSCPLWWEHIIPYDGAG
jgi:glycosyltransferase involved in cell wall biosynthesis